MHRPGSHSSTTNGLTLFGSSNASGSPAPSFQPDGQALPEHFALSEHEEDEFAQLDYPSLIAKQAQNNKFISVATSGSEEHLVLVATAKKIGISMTLRKTPDQNIKVFENNVLNLDRHIATLVQAMQDMGQELREKTKQRKAHRKRLLQAELDRDVEAPAFDQIKQFGFYASAITTLLSSGSAATLPGQAEITGKLTNAISHLQAAVREAEAHSQDSPMDGTGPTEAAPLGRAEAADPAPEV